MQIVVGPVELINDHEAAIGERGDFGVLLIVHVAE